MKMFGFLPFVFILAASSFRTESGITARFFSNPTTFVNSMAGADKDTIAKLIDFAKGLIQEGEDVRATVLQAKADADAEAKVAADALDAASAFLDFANEEEKEARERLAFTTAKEAETRTIMDDAEAHKIDSQEKFDQAQATMDTELARIAQEDADLKEVQGLLEELMPVFIEKSLGRALLSEVDAEIDPQALQKIIDLVVKLIAAGEQDARDFTKARDDAQEVLTAAIEAYEAAFKEHTHWFGAKDVSTDCLNEKIAQTAKAVQEKNDATAEKARKDGAAADAEVHRAAEEKRIDEERELFEKVIALLEELA